jgi:exopolyphosphatase / guanosine-5'-triphosphate,3'-diphosphate pyrophosphatase
VIVAAIDLGTNTSRLLVADVAGGRLRELQRETRITRLGEGVDRRGRLLPAPIARVRNALTDYRRTAESLHAERTLLIATSAVRDAENGEAFLGEIEWSYGFATRLLSGDEEAELTLLGVSSGRPVDERTLVLDIGGGSTELIAGGFHESLELGSVRHTERFLHTDPPAPRELAECAEAARSVLAEGVPEEVLDHVRDGIGVAGTVTTLAALDLGLAAYDRARVHGHRLSRAGARRQLERLAALPLAERRRVPALEPERAPVIVAGAVILVELLEHVRLDAVEVSEHDILDGAALAAAELPPPGEGPARRAPTPAADRGRSRQ